MKKSSILIFGICVVAIAGGITLAAVWRLGTKAPAIPELRSRGIHVELPAMEKAFPGQIESPPFPLLNGMDADDFIHTPCLGLSATAFSNYRLQDARNISALRNFLKANQELFEKVRSADFSKLNLRYNFATDFLAAVAQYCGVLSHTGRALSVKIEGDILDGKRAAAVQTLGDMVKVGKLLSAVPYTPGNVALCSELGSFCYSAERVLCNFALQPAEFQKIRELLQEARNEVLRSFDHTVIGAGYQLFGAPESLAVRYLSGNNSWSPHGRKTPASGWEMWVRRNFYRKHLFLAGHGLNNFQNYTAVKEKWAEVETEFQSPALRDDLDLARFYRENLRLTVRLKLLTVATAIQQYHQMQHRYPESVQELLASKLLSPEEALNPITGKFFEFKQTAGKFKALAGHRGNTHYEKFETRPQIEIRGGELPETLIPGESRLQLNLPLAPQ